jgi:membrane-associated phospholipid phosphatase
LAESREKSILRIDLKQFWFDLKWVYPTALNRIVQKWQASVIALFIIFSSFYLDYPFLVIFTSIDSQFWDNIFVFGRWYGSGNPTLYLFITLYISGIIFKKVKLRDTGLLIGEAFAFAGLITLIFKSFFGRWRPFTNMGELSFYGLNWTDNDKFSLSSGHANVAFSLSMVLASTTDNIYLKIFYYALAVNTSISRIYHNQHWLSDVVIGALIAILISKVLINFHKLKFKAVDTIKV